MCFHNWPQKLYLISMPYNYSEYYKPRNLRNQKSENLKALKSCVWTVCYRTVQRQKRGLVFFSIITEAK